MLTVSPESSRASAVLSPDTPAPITRTSVSGYAIFAKYLKSRPRPMPAAAGQRDRPQSEPKLGACGEEASHASLKWRDRGRPGHRAAAVHFGTAGQELSADKPHSHTPR